MNAITKKIRLAFDRPERIQPYLKSNIAMSAQYLQKGQPHLLITALCDGLIGWNPYIEYLKKKASGDTVVLKNVYGNKMRIDLNDSGMSKCLLMFGKREIRSTNIFRNELSSLHDRCSNPVVLEIGANIGYFALQEADLLGDTATVLATEPVPKTRQLLRENVRINNFESRFIIDDVAVAGESETRGLRIKSSSNQSDIVDDPTEGKPINAKNPIDFINKHDFSPSDINVLRMDLQGLEYEILPEIEPILKSSSPFVLFVEFHTTDSNSLGLIVSLLEENFELVAASRADGCQTWYEYPASVETFRDLTSIQSSVSIIAIRK